MSVQKGDQILNPKIINFLMNIFFIILILELLGSLLFLTPNFRIDYPLKEAFYPWRDGISFCLIFSRLGSIFFLFISLIALLIRKRQLTIFYFLASVLGLISWGLWLYFSYWFVLYGPKGIALGSCFFIVKFFFVSFFKYLKKKNGLT